VQAVIIVAAKTLLGGALVLVFAALSGTLEPKRLAGLLWIALIAATGGWLAVTLLLYATQRVVRRLAERRRRSA
jgi:hypothetical protein